MALSKDFRETVAARAARDPAFKAALLKEGLQALLAGDTAAGLIVLRDYINATIGFSALSKAIHVHEKSLMRMVGPRGNPRAANLFAMVGALQKKTHIEARIETSLRQKRETLETLIEETETLSEEVEALMESVTSKNRAAEAVRGPIRRAPAQRPAAKR